MCLWRARGTGSLFKDPPTTIRLLICAAAASRGLPSSAAENPCPIECAIVAPPAVQRDGSHEIFFAVSVDHGAISVLPQCRRLVGLASARISVCWHWLFSASWRGEEWIHQCPLLGSRLTVGSCW